LDERVGAEADERLRLHQLVDAALVGGVVEVVHALVALVADVAEVLELLRARHGAERSRGAERGGPKASPLPDFSISRCTPGRPLRATCSVPRTPPPSPAPA